MHDAPPFHGTRRWSVPAERAFAESDLKVLAARLDILCGSDHDEYGRHDPGVLREHEAAWRSRCDELRGRATFAVMIRYFMGDIAPDRTVSLSSLTGGRRLSVGLDTEPRSDESEGTQRWVEACLVLMTGSLPSEAVASDVRDLTDEVVEAAVDDAAFAAAANIARRDLGAGAVEIRPLDPLAGPSSPSVRETLDLMRAAEDARDLMLEPSRYGERVRWTCALWRRRLA